VTGSAVAYLIRIELRRRGRSLVLLGLLTSIIVAVALASLAGGRRSATAFDRYLEVLRSPEAGAFGTPEALEQLGDVDAVQAAIPMELISAFPEAEGLGEFYPLVVDPTGQLLYERMRAPVVDGRLPDRDAPLELVVGERTARRLDLEVGDPLPIATFDQRTTDIFNEDENADVAPTGALELEVVGIVRDPGDIASREEDITLSFLSPAFRERYGADEVGILSGGTMVAVAPGYDLADVSRAMEGEPLEIDASFSPESARQQVGPTMEAIGTALRVFGLVAAAAGLLAVGQAVARLQQAASADDETLGALGANGRERWARLVVPSGLAVVSGALLGVGIAVAASPLFPIGLARRADPDLGLHVDGTVILLGGAAAVLLVGGLVAVLGLWRVRRPESAAPAVRVGWTARAAAEAGLSTPAVAGLSLATGTRGRPGRVAVGGTLVSVLGVLAAMVFSASIDDLLDEPQRYGWGWDANIEGQEITALGEELSGAVEERLREDPDVLAFSTLYTQVPVTLEGSPAYVTATEEADPALEPVLVRGEIPTGAAEIAVGGVTLSSIGADVGDTVRLVLGDAEESMRISGVVAFHVPEDGGSSSSGVYLTPESVEELDVATACKNDFADSCTASLAVALQPDADQASFVDRYLAIDGVDVALPTPPGEVDRLTAVEDLPRYLALFLAFLAAVAISFATTTTVRQRRRDLAMLRVLGMTAGHVRRVVVALVLALTGAGAAIGGVLGLIVGRQVWRAVTDSISLPFEPTLPVLAAVLVPVATVLLAQLVATSSRRRAGRTPAALVLRAE
jgi:hypothetical protein